MINGFSEQTHELTEYELSIVPVFVKGFATKIGKSNAVTNKEIVAKLKPQYKVSDARVRKIVNYIRNECLLPGLIASSHGYYLTTDPVELETYIQSLAQRANEINRVKNSMIAYYQQLKRAS
jgi:hypothetical protein